MKKLTVIIMIFIYLVLTTGMAFAKAESDVDNNVGKEAWGIDSCPIVHSSIADGRLIMAHDCDIDGEADRYCVYSWNYENKTATALTCMNTSELLPGTLLKGSFIIGKVASGVKP